MIDVRRCTVDDLVGAPNFTDVIAEYARESSVAEVGKVNPQLDTYRLMESGGTFHPIGAFNGELLVGFVMPIVVVLPHYGVVGAAIESIFVVKAERKRGVGLVLLAKAEELAKSLGAKALLLSSPVNSALSRVMSKRKKYRHSNDVFVTALA